MQEGFQVGVVLLWTRKLRAVGNIGAVLTDLPLNATTADTADVLSTIKVTQQGQG